MLHLAGKLLMNFVVEDSHCAGLEEVDASRGRMNEHILRRWTRGRRFHYEILLFNSKPTSQVLRWTESTLKPALKRVVGR